MPKISDIVAKETGEQIGLPGAPDVETPEVEPSSGFSLNLAWLRAETGEGTIESYLDHPLNFQRSRGLAQALRGVTGLVGDLKLAVVDIAVGILNYMKERATHGPVDTVQR